ncbi:SpoIIIAH-like family protein [uncultured Subdoligranulum sp.]|uniref:SpoIIIAH-like family protein n=1 Tax=uncultured Subdoligranulum sp. TaxID=512298 RepID=UPI0025FFED10|nr:SpoIIIAH-like family protein [uncultured Subdoligranulum sp.]
MKHTANKPTKSRQATAAVMVLALGAAVYLNWSFARQAPQDLTVTAENSTAVETAAAAETSAVIDPFEDVTETAGSSDAVQEGEAVNKNYGEAQMVSVSQDSGTEFFEEARLSRSKARDEALEALNKALKDTSVNEEEKKALTDKLSTQVNNITLETKLETLIKSKGFADCVVNLEGEKANVTVMTENDALTSEEVARIRDALISQCTGLDAQDITIVEVK